MARRHAYIDNIGFDFPAGEFAPGILALVSPDAAARQVADAVAFPNGMVVTPDNATLILGLRHRDRRQPLEPPGWADLDGGAPDGICLDAENAVWYADVPNKRCVRVREGGEMLQTVELDRGCFACMLGGADRRTLFLMANEWPASMDGRARTGQVLTVQAPAPGVGWP